MPGGAGDIDRTGMLGGGPGSAPGDRRCIGRGGPGACIATGSRLVYADDAGAGEGLSDSGWRELCGLRGRIFRHVAIQGGAGTVYSWALERRSAR